ncbi:MAG: tRNA (adenosine(37)-N6)-threonylcarbamoyltransferase complex transferase subunit TsaD [Candidatus Marinimicrobia bacterium]|jgi:N6-L-threonylcarbamoyladenine synthase|nr:tRNA (adenosine(37)-N6)-threonylcarbamoyltransferase complex transferase subunit TsaD [Candidatus Neomarinimicrobiota bacterium]MDD4960921.1 tRNA (adenosine(37)-N6)-threonylcarbamoyltransferase complex transferase subunit TsaD [Candidatus Neomarinimicrobiota bacterium]MDD5709665.1 tRNA (adenosine(37)-N6)-threonylcarbamoyltransferase complex transferase subunit TsaD [Candidatus Neomarinimicrobiota bacterium]MDX9777411.1 tRNA (adenosine(37)-N6)-threonylcarbamoyltransferase complex transferase s
MTDPDLFPCILGIESSCDETSAAVLEGFHVRSHIVYSQMIHKKYGGVVPELASRAHEHAISQVVHAAFEASGKSPEDIDALAVTYGPGLMGALLVGLNYAKGFALARDIPLIGVNHVEAHLYAPMLEFPELKPPFLSLLVSGGHTMLVDVRGMRDFSILGSTRDDAAGESFDKTARLLQIGYPGGPVIDTLSDSGNPRALRFPRSLLEADSLDFSFSGMKTAVLNHVRKHPELSDKEKADIAASFQEAVVDVLKEKLRRAVRASGHKRVVLAGGVAANRRLRAELKKMAEKMQLELYYPPLEYCTDNAAMIAATGVMYQRAGLFSDLEIAAVPNLKLA